MRSGKLVFSCFRILHCFQPAQPSSQRKSLVLDLPLRQLHPACIYRRSITKSPMKIYSCVLIPCLLHLV